jgi:hypothetical protein
MGRASMPMILSIGANSVFRLVLFPEAMLTFFFSSKQKFYGIIR